MSEGVPMDQLTDAWVMPDIPGKAQSAKATAAADDLLSVLQEAEQGGK